MVNNLENILDIIDFPNENGFHLITKPFNMEEFRALHPTIDIHKDNPSILYIP